MADATPLVDQTCAEVAQSIGDTLDTQGNALTCDAIAGGVMRATGKTPFWIGCLSWGKITPVSHAARCVLMQALAADTAPPDHTADCDVIAATYQNGVRAASLDNSLPDGFTADCDVLQAASLLWSASRSDWLRCRGYTPKDEEAHATACLADEIDSLSKTEATCQSLRQAYQRKLTAAYGRLPDGFRPVPCPKLRDVIAELNKRAALSLEERRKATEIAQQIRMAAAEDRADKAATGMAVIIGGLLLAGLASDGGDAAAYQEAPRFGPGSPSCTSGAALYDPNIGAMLGC